MKKEFFNNYNEILYKCEKPSRYIGGEFLSTKKDFDNAKVAVALAFPDKYEIGISNFGHKILYHTLNEREEFLADRVYAPEKDFVELLRASGRKLYSLDSKKPLREFDFIGFALQYELSYTTLLAMLEMSGISVLSNERAESDPIILAGGPCAFNPAPMSKFIDLFLIGDGEELLVEICEKYAELRDGGLPRAQIIKKLSEIEGVYCPLHKANAQEAPAAAPCKIKKRIAQLSVQSAPTKSPIPHFVSVHDRATVEIRRGCARLCRFCQSAHTNLPIRERPRADVVELAKEYVKNTGYDEYSLLSLSSNDHSEIENIIEELNAHFEGGGVTVSLPSQRADNFSLRLANLMGSVKKSAVTLAPEAGTQRMRDIIRKNLTQEQILSATLASVQNGWQKIKFYFMIGLPFELESDLKGIVDLLAEINKACRSNGLKLPQITCSVSIFVPKPFTPFQLCAQNTLAQIEQKISFLRDSLRSANLKNVRLNYHEPKVSQMEAFLTRGDERVGDFIYEMFRQGAYLESWNENFDFEKCSEVAKKLGLDIEALASAQISPEAELPWGNINCGLEESYFASEFEKAKEAAQAPVTTNP